MKDPYFSTKLNIERLLEQYRLHGNIIVGFDFDDTIFDFHEVGHTYPKVVNLLKNCAERGFTMVLLTAKETYDELKESTNYCKKLGIRVDYINESPILPDSNKPFVNILLDDKAGLKQAYNILKGTIERI